MRGAWADAARKGRALSSYKVVNPHSYYWGGVPYSYSWIIVGVDGVRGAGADATRGAEF